MAIRVNDPSCLKPRLLGCSTPRSSRIEGILTRNDDDQSVLIDAIHFDGERCSYRALGREVCWHTEQDGDEFQCCAQTIMNRLRQLDDDPSADLSVVDSVMTDNGDLLVAVRNESGGYCRWMPLPA